MKAMITDDGRRILAHTLDTECTWFSMTELQKIAVLAGVNENRARKAGREQLFIHIRQKLRRVKRVSE